MTINLNKSYLTEKFKTADTADKLRAVTTEQIRNAFSDGSMTTVQAENIRLQLLRFARVQEVDELKQSLLDILTVPLAAEFPDAVIDAGTKRGYPYVTVWPKGKWQEGDDE
jgi:hypothetical protein